MKISSPCVWVVAALLSLALTAQAEQKIGLVDLEKVFEKYYKTIQSNIALKQEADGMQAEHVKMLDAEKKHEEDWRKMIDRANDQAISADERAKANKDAESKYVDLQSEKQSIDEFDHMAVSRIQEKRRQKRDDIVKEIQGVLNADARQAGYSMVLDISGQSINMAPVVIYNNGQNDMTDSLIKELNSTAPPGALDTNAPPAAASSSPIGK